MVNDIIDIIIGRFRSISALDVNQYETSSFRYINVNSCTNICCLYFKSDSIYIVISGRWNAYVQEYNDLTDVDEFIGSILCIAFYE